MAINLVFVVLR